MNSWSLSCILILFMIYSSISGQNNQSSSQNVHSNWLITSAGHFSFQITNTAGLPDSRTAFFREFPFEITLGEVGISFFKGRIGLGTHVFKREVPYHFLVKDHHPFFLGLGKNSWVPLIIRAPITINMENNWLKGVSAKYELSTLESFRSETAYQTFTFNSHTLGIELNAQGSVIELGYCYHQKILSSAYFPQGKNYLFLKIGLGILGNYFWNPALNREIIRKRQD